MKEVKKSYNTPKLDKMDVRLHTLGQGSVSIDDEGLEGSNAAS